jgi:hypothetical protein
MTLTLLFAHASANRCSNRRRASETFVARSQRPAIARPADRALPCLDFGLRIIAGSSSIEPLTQANCAKAATTGHRRATIRQIAARGLGVLAHELGIKTLMPRFMADAMSSLMLLRNCRNRKGVDNAPQHNAREGVHGLLLQGA